VSRRAGICLAALALGGACIWLGLATLHERDAVARSAVALAAPVTPASLPAGPRLLQGPLGTADERQANAAALAYASAGAQTSPAAATRAAADAESQLLPLTSDGPAVRRAWAATLLGVLEYARASLDRPNARRHVEQSLEALRAAAVADPANEDAKADLELLLSRRQQQKQQKQKQGAHKKPQPKPAATSSGAGSGW
jgi:hypothetical protein